MYNRKKVLVVDDNAINRKILSEILAEEYDIVEAECAAEALRVLGKTGNGVSLIMLDIVMPEMDGYSFINEMKKVGLFAVIPIVVITASDNPDEEIRSLQAGANDFVTKPYNTEIVRHRVRNILSLKENSAMLKLLKYDSVTGVLSKDYFFRTAQMYVEHNPDKQYDIICSDIDDFKVINEKYGEETSTQLLKFIANSHLTNLGENGICGRIGADVFAMLVERGHSYTVTSFYKKLEEDYKKAPVQRVIVKYGIYHITDNDAENDVHISAMCDRAMLAMRSIKHIYGVCYAEYTEEVRIALLKEQQITYSMERALEERQFVVYIQPKHDAMTGKVIGGEALVRWIHPEFGFISPGDFIPLFERNGFITKLDLYVWDEVCDFISNRIKSNLPIVPVSVNVSRLDFNMPDLVDNLRNLLNKYNLPNNMIHLEVTESAYKDDPDRIIKVVEDLRNNGYIIEMDDFGSGYSSLNMLSELPIDILKLDMNFMKGTASKKGILSFVISLSKWLDFPTVAEGVETEEDYELLKSLGCNYIQGYYFAKPMSKKEFERYLDEHHDSDDDVNKISDSIRLEAKIHDGGGVLIVEDIELNRDILKEALEPYYFVKAVENGEEAYNYLVNNPGKISVVLLDLMMPVMDGFRFMSLFNENPDFSDISVLITSEYTPTGESRALELGAIGFLPKPYYKKVILNRIEMAFEHNEFKKTHITITE